MWSLELYDNTGMKVLPMGYLALACKEGEEIRLAIDPGADFEGLAGHILREKRTHT